MASSSATASTAHAQAAMGPGPMGVGRQAPSGPVEGHSTQPKAARASHGDRYGSASGDQERAPSPWGGRSGWYSLPVPSASRPAALKSPGSEVQSSAWSSRKWLAKFHVREASGRRPDSRALRDGPHSGACA